MISVDGGRTRIRYAKKGKRRPKTNRHGYVGEWQEPKLLTIYVVDEQGKRINNAEFPVTNDGTYGNFKPFLELLEMHLVRLGIEQAKQVLLVADGAEWIWKNIPPLLQRLGCPPDSCYELLDFYHATEHLQRFAEAAFTQPAEKQAWFKQARQILKRGGIADLRRHYAGFEKGQSWLAPFNYDFPDWLLHQRAAGRTVELFSCGG